MTHQPKAYKKFVATAATATLVATAVAPVAASAASDFVDVNKNYEEAVNYLVEQGITEGMPGNKFGTDLNIKRGDAAVFIARALKLDTENAEDQNFSDLNNRVKGAVNAVVAEGIASGKGLGKFNPDDLITRQEMAKMLSNAYELTSDKDAPFTDVNKNWMKYVSNLYENGITLGKTEDTFLPNANLTRGEFALFMYRAETLDEKPTEPEVPATDGITNVKAINDTTVEVEFGQAIDKDFVREAEKNGKYFVVYLEGKTAHSKVDDENVLQSKTITFSKDRKTAKVVMNKGEFESGKKYSVALLDGKDNKVADVVHSYGPTVLKEGAERPEFEVSAVADKIFVDFGEKMKSSALDIKYYTVYDEGGKKLGALKDYLDTDFLKDTKDKGKWVDATTKDEVEFTLASKAEGKNKNKSQLLAGKTYKLKVEEDVKTDDNKKLSDDDRTITIDTPSVDEAKPAVSSARIVKKDTFDVVFDKDIVAGTFNINQLEVKTSTGKTVALKNAKVTQPHSNTLRVTFTSDTDNKLEGDVTYKLDVPANLATNAVFPNASNEAVTEAKAEAQDNIEIKAVDAELVASPKNKRQADLLLTFDQRPEIEKWGNKIEIQDGTDVYKLDSNAEIKVYGGDSTGKTVVIEDVKSVFKDGTVSFKPEADVSYKLEIAAKTVHTDAFTEGTNKVNQSKLKTTFNGVSVTAPAVDKVNLVSATEMEVVFKEDISDISENDIYVSGFETYKNGNFAAVTLNGENQLNASVSGNVLTITAEDDTAFPTGFDKDLFEIEIKDDSFTSAGSKVENAKIKLTADKGQPKIAYGTASAEDLKKYEDNAAPVILGVATENGSTKAKDNEVFATFSENVEFHGDKNSIATLFSVNNAANNATGKSIATTADKNVVKVAFDDVVFDKDTIMSEVEVVYTEGNSFYIKDSKANKAAAATIEGVKGKKPTVAGDTEKPTEPSEPTDPEKPTDPEAGDTVKASELDVAVVSDGLGSTMINLQVSKLTADQKGKKASVVVNGKTYEFVVNKFDETVLTATIPGTVTLEEAEKLEVTFK